MAEILFFMTHADTRTFCEFLIKEFDARFALDRCPMPEPPVYQSADEVSAIVGTSKHRPRFFVQSPLWDRYPLYTTEVHTNDGRHFFSIAQRYGGPAFDFIVSRYQADGDNCYVIPGILSDYPWYIVDKSWSGDYSKYRTFDLPAEMAKAYRAVRNYVRRNGKRSTNQRSGKTGPWILDDALSQYHRGLWLRQGDERFLPKSSA